MFDFQEKRKMRSLLYSRYTIGFLFVLIAVLSVSVFERFSVEREMKEKRAASEVELEALLERAAHLEEKVNHLKNERGIEEELRSRFDVAKKGEQVVIIVDDEEVAENTIEPIPEASDEKKGWSVLKLLKLW